MHKATHIWRATLEDPRTGEQKSFINLEGLVGFLRSLGENIEREADEMHS